MTAYQVSIIKFCFIIKICYYDDNNARMLKVIVPENFAFAGISLSIKLTIRNLKHLAALLYCFLQLNIQSAYSQILYQAQNDKYFINFQFYRLYRLSTLLCHSHSKNCQSPKLS